MRSGPPARARAVLALNVAVFLLAVAAAVRCGPAPGAVPGNGQDQSPAAGTSTPWHYSSATRTASRALQEHQEQEQAEAAVAAKPQPKCPRNTHLCGRVCKANKDTRACGTQCRKCPSPPRGSAAICRNGACAVTCLSSFVRANGSCVCPPGTSPKQVRRVWACATCSRNTYKDAASNDACKPCPDGRQTAGEAPNGHGSVNDCLPGGLLAPDNDEEPPRTAEFAAHLALARQFTLRGGPSAAGGAIIARLGDGVSSAASPPAGCLINCREPPSDAGLARLIAHLAGGEHVFAAGQPLAPGLPSRRAVIKDQGSCATCVNAALATAAEVAASTLLAVAADTIELPGSVGYFCDSLHQRGCGTGWTFDGVLEAMQASPHLYFFNASCAARYNLAQERAAGRTLLQAACSAISSCAARARLLQGCTANPLVSFADIQHALRRSGAVLSRVKVSHDMLEFFKANPSGIFSRPGNDSNAFDHAVVIVGYDNANAAWVLQNSYGTAFANGGLFRVAYGMLGIGGPNSTFELNCSLPGGAARPTPPALRWPVEADADVNGCYWFVPRGSEQLSAIADHFGVDILDLIIDNAARGVFDWMDSQATRPDLSTPLTGKRLHVCGISKPLATVADLACPAGMLQSGGTACVVCPKDTVKPRSGPGSCQRCPQGTTTGDASDFVSSHDEESDCQPVTELGMCEQFIGKTTTSGLFNVTLDSKTYRVYCDMETDGGGWTLILNYNHAAGTSPRTRVRDLTDGFVIKTDAPLGTDESGNTEAWGHMWADALGLVPSVVELRLQFSAFLFPGQTEPLVTHFKSTDTHTIRLFQEGVPGREQALNTNGWLTDSTVLDSHNFWMLPDSTGGFNVDTPVWPDPAAPSQMLLYFRGASPSPKDCPPGMYAAGYGCHTCPDHTFKAVAGPGPCTPCPAGQIAATRDTSFNYRKTEDFVACKPAEPDAVLTSPRNTTWEVFASIRAKWAKAEEVCVSRGGHLVTLQSPTDHDTLWVNIRDRRPPEYPARVEAWWIGLHDPDGPAGPAPWQWVSGAPLRYARWQARQPDNFVGDQGRYAVITSYLQSHLDDLYSYSRQRFVCEV